MFFIIFLFNLYRGWTKIQKLSDIKSEQIILMTLIIKLDVTIYSLIIIAHLRIVIFIVVANYLDKDFPMPRVV